ncbi:tRNA (adenosine(37)-N6)-threonylcarbamoyltransferase complex ATPase subunit type 1 TsaE [Legionella brunensis]|uniref:tRNA threonylcarbamoyladenosine biosynthesis protein TsaE n=1 Tax=Legionella brunensis TaxID=29422 RepID=A0A0W0SP39_9GAMM|nr:tRNA (adenosine(37)-N6)-threonylcarbamoyltransferase complex ATPase subunit type 1 TsaE [Legionella brunensis]KTC85154.1 ATPase or kinase [Legionella brunensis]
MTKYDLVLPDESSSESLATSLATMLFSPLVLSFSGEIGAGKTTFIRAMLRALGVKTAVKSPSFSLVESYQCNNFQVHHFDLYRIHDEAELEYIGFRDYFRENSVCCIEWPEHGGHFLERVDLNFAFVINGSGRLLTINASSPAGEKMLSCLASKQ